MVNVVFGKLSSCLVFLISVLLLVQGCGPQQVAPEPPAELPEPVVVEDVAAEDAEIDASSISGPAEEQEPVEENPAAPKCGDGVCNGAENCDKCFKDCACASPAECYQGSCKVPECGADTECNDKDPCTKDKCAFAQHPNAFCSHEVIDDPKNGDKCCPPHENTNTDTDCEPVCGNNACEPGETEENCDDDCPDEPDCGNQKCEAGEQNSCPRDCM